MPYNTEERTFEMYARPLWNWAMDIVQDPHLADFFVWDAEQCYIFDENKWHRFYTEPWTAAAMWDIQVGHSFLCCAKLTRTSRLPVENTQVCQQQTSSVYHLCRQGQAIVLRHSEGLSCDRETREYGREYSQ